ncbi:MAG: TIGR00529 family membrane protein [Thermococci archaeon]|nr:TIGR00529 family membrane protein [Thermococci archaeon]
MDVVYLLVSFSVIILLIWRKVNVGVSIFAGSVVLAALFGASPSAMLRGLYSSTTSWGTVRLLLIISSILGLTSVFSQTGYLKSMEKAARELFPSMKYSLAVLPALIGLMPMPAGALVSAPMIEASADELDLSPGDRTLINYWFRHVWENSMPMYQAIVIASVILGISVKEITVKMFPLTVIMLLLGYFLMIRPLPVDDPRTRDIGGGLKLLLRSTYPIILIVLTSVVLGVDMVIGAMIGFVSALLPHLRDVSLKKVAVDALQPKILFLMVSVMYFKYVLTMTGVVESLPGTLLRVHAPVLAVLILTPFIVGLMTGISFAYVGMTFPLLLPFFHGFGDVALAYLSGYMGMLFSPVHLCLIFSADYYGADLGNVYRRLALPGALFYALGVIYIFLALGG